MPSVNDPQPRKSRLPFFNATRKRTLRGKRIISEHVLLVATCLSALWVGYYGITEWATMSQDLDTPPHSSRLLSELTSEEQQKDIALGKLDYPPTWDINALKQGGILVVILIALYMFCGLAIVCDEYFESSLEAICDKLHLPTDVAGATFMAAGGSAPELFTSIMGVFVAKSDIGFGTIVGSAVFNVLFVIACCCWIAPGLSLHWWPLVRDSFFYCLSIIILVFFILDQQVYWYEALMLLGLYVIYILIMYFNENLFYWTERKLIESEDVPPIKCMNFSKKVQKLCGHWTFNTVVYALIIVNTVVVILEMTECSDETKSTINMVCNIAFVTEMALKMLGWGFFGYWQDTMNAFDGTLVFLVVIDLVLTAQTGEDGGGNSSISGLRSMRVLRFFKGLRVLRVLRLYRAMDKRFEEKSTQTEDADWQMAPTGILPSRATQKRLSLAASIKTDEHTRENMDFIRNSRSSKVAPEDKRNSKGASIRTPDVEVEGQGEDGPTKEEAEPEKEEEEEEEEEPGYPWDLPEGHIGYKLLWLILLPISLAMFFTVPHCGREGRICGKGPAWAGLFPVTFIMCIVWIGLLSYVMVWMASIAGVFYGIPDPVMGLTFLAAGTSIPDCMSSLAVARRGHGDMAVSSSIGSNVFDILIGLPIPWFLYGVIFGAPVEIKSQGITIMVLTLFVMVALVITGVHVVGWKLTMKLGYFMMVLYFYFVAQSLILELMPDILRNGCT